jgi:serine/threonine protein kinase/tetratricopeptide (TPR) repeat protein
VTTKQTATDMGDATADSQMSSSDVTLDGNLQIAHASMSLPVSVAADYEILDQLGAGGMGVVYLARDRARDQLVALKTLHRLEPAALLRLKNEFRRVADITHPNLVGLYELRSSDDHWYFTMEYLEGRSLHELLAERRGAQAGPTLDDGPTTTIGPHARLTMDPSHGDPSRVDPTVTLDSLVRTPLHAVEVERERAVEDDELLASQARGPLLDQAELQVFGDLLRGVRALHRVGMLHCDIKPANVMITEGRARLLDFGLVIPRVGGETGLSGTPAYMAPEQVAGAAPSEASDWYAIGTMLFEALSGRRPFTGSVVEILSEKVEADAPALPAFVHAQFPELAALTARLLARDPEQRPAAAELFAAFGIDESERDSSLRGHDLVGRTRHLDALHAALASCDGHRPVVVEVHGRSGTGKSVLVDRFLDEAGRRPDTVVLRGSCYERESVPYKAFDSLVDSLTEYLRHLPEVQVRAVLPEHVDDLVRVFPVLARVKALQGLVQAGGGAGRQRDQQELRRRAFRALKQLLAALSSNTRLVLAIDDVQWGDRDSGQMLREILSPPGAPWLFLLLSYRTEQAEGSAFLAEVRAALSSAEDIDARTLAVEPLDAEQARQLAASLLEVDESDPRVARIAAESQGIPFFVEELSRYFAAGGDLDVTLGQVVRRRAEVLPADARELLAAVAVAGRPIAQRIAAGVAGLTSNRFGTFNLLRSNHLVRTHGPNDVDGVEAYHDRIREGVVASLDDATRADVHRRLALELERAEVDEPEHLAMHWFAAGELDRAGRHAIAAGDRAARALAFDTAVGLYARAAECLPNEPGLAIKRADALVNAGRLGDAAELYLSAAQAAATPVETQRLRRRAAEQFLLSGRIDAGMAILRPLLAEFGIRYPSSPKAALFGIIFRSIRLGIRGFEFVSRPESEIAAEGLDRIDVCWAAGRGLGSVDIMRGAYYLTRATALALELGEPRRASRGLAQLGLSSVSRGGEKDVRQGRAHIARATAIGEQLDDPLLIGFAKINAGTGSMTLGEWRDAWEQLHEGGTMLENRCTGVAWELSFAHAVSGCVLRNLGWMRELAVSGPRWLQTAEQLGDKYGAVWARIHLSGCELVGGDWKAAHALLTESVESWTSQIFTPQHLFAEVLISETERYRGDHRAALDRIDRMWDTAERSFAMGWQLNRVLSHHARACAQLGLAAQSKAGAGAWLAGAEQQARKLDKQRRHYAHAAAALVRGSAANIAGDTNTAIEHFQTAQGFYEQAEMSLMLACARRSRGRLLGGDQGRELVEQAESTLRREGVADIPRWTAIYCPGIDRDAGA